MADNTFSLQILTPKRVFFDAPVSLLVVTLPDGEVGILKNHAPMAAAIASGMVRFVSENETKIAALADGFLTVAGNRAVITVLSAQWPEEIDIARAQELETLARERMSQRQSVAQYRQAQMMLTRAMVRLRVSAERDRINQ